MATRDRSSTQKTPISLYSKYSRLAWLLLIFPIYKSIFSYIEHDYALAFIYMFVSIAVFAVLLYGHFAVKKAMQ